MQFGKLTWVFGSPDYCLKPRIQALESEIQAIKKNIVITFLLLPVFWCRIGIIGSRIPREQCAAEQDLRATLTRHLAIITG